MGHKNFTVAFITFNILGNVFFPPVIKQISEYQVWRICFALCFGWMQIRTNIQASYLL